MTQIINDLVLSLPDDKEEEFFSIRNDIRASLVKTEKGHISNCLENFVLVLQKEVQSLNLCDSVFRTYP